MIRRAGKIIAAALLALGLAGRASATDAGNWEAVAAEASGQTVYFNAWGGSENVNAYIRWAGDEMKARYGVTVVHVKLDDTAKATATVLAEKSAGKDEGGSVDLVWINGENFAAMKRQGLLYAPGWATKLPNWRYVDHENMPTVLTDFTIPTDGLESPWGGAKLVFFYDSARMKASELPDSAADLLEWAAANPGRFSYPQPPDFTGSSFLKQVLIELVDDRAKLQKPVDETTFATDAAPLFAYLDRLTPLLWRKGKAYPQNYADMKQKLADGELDIIFAFNPAEASSAIANGELPETVRSFAFPAARSAIPISSPFPTTQRQRPARFCLPISSSRPRRSFASRIRRSGATRPCFLLQNFRQPTGPLSSAWTSALQRSAPANSVPRSTNRTRTG
ncbi:ABC transporter substrate-binding protein [Sinorhizobium meliloti]|uniref:ABC transporter substrate-binding protein n=1 Tax=Rhizobium meliloti TaxID=382 RepID=UPI001F47EC1C|nr:ABC transporter substrate-binding protein [Sinorhizobium meliloti]